MIRPIRVLLAKPGLDGHDRGAKVAALALRDAVFEVIYTGLHQTVEQIVEAAAQRVRSGATFSSWRPSDRDGEGGRGLIQLRRVYQPPASGEGKRFLVERLWPRGIKRETLALDGWLKDAAPSDALRRWFAHDPAKWTEFQRRYRAELDAKPEAWQPLLKAARRGKVTLLYSARDTEHNNALALKAYLEEKERRL